MPSNKSVKHTATAAAAAAAASDIAVVDVAEGICTVSDALAVGICGIITGGAVAVGIC
jgi:hypothetical protein